MGISFEGRHNTGGRGTHHAVACMANILAVDENHGGGWMINGPEVITQSTVLGFTFTGKCLESTKKDQEEKEEKVPLYNTILMRLNGDGGILEAGCRGS